MVSLSTLFHTLRHLRPIQILGRPWHLLKRKFLRVGLATNLPTEAGRLKAELKPPPVLSFAILNRRKEYFAGEMIWTDAAEEKLWRYTLNYFDFIGKPASGFDLQTQRFLVLDWIERNADEEAEPWEPYVISKRLVNWISWLKANPDLPVTEARLIHESLFFQAKRLRYDLEYHILANHLFENLKALFLVSCRLSEFLPDRRTILLRWMKSCEEELTRQIRRQVLPDGGHYEGSPMYHQIILNGLRHLTDSRPNAEKFIDPALNFDLVQFFDLCHSTINSMEKWLAALTHPDGRISLFGDSAFELPAPKPGVPTRTEFLTSSGFVTHRWGTGHYFVLSCHAPSPEFQPGHSHADITSFELSLNGRRVIVDTGCGSYQNAEIRAYCRNTAAHNVPTVAGCEQSELWGNFRIGRRGKILNREFSGEPFRFSGIYRDFSGNEFSRTVHITRDSVDVLDTLLKRVREGPFESWLHISPGFRVKKLASGAVSLADTSGSVSIESPGPVEILDGRYYPEFGKAESIVRLRFSDDNKGRIGYVIRNHS